MKKRFTEEQIIVIGFLREADAGMPIKELHRQHGLGITEKVVSAPSRRERVRHMLHRGLSQRRALTGPAFIAPGKTDLLKAST